MTTTKTELIRCFERNKGKMLSGEQLASDLGITRAAVWKAINSLRQEGYDITSVKKMGYMLNVNSDILSLVKITEKLSALVDIEFKLYKTIDSTNRKAKLLALTEDREWVVVASEKQEEGRGRERKSFPSPEGKGVYVSVVLKPSKAIRDLKLFLNLAAECTQKAIKKVAGIDIEIKQPSDIVYQDKKLGGILTEASIEVETGRIDFVVIGIGINVYGKSEDFSSSQDDIHTSLSEITGKYCNRSYMIAEIMNELAIAYPLLQKE